MIQRLPEISVILPFYNAKGTLERALESIANQTFTNFECIMVNNRSTDTGESIARDFAACDRRFILAHEPEQGVVFASNKGASMARGHYIARMDADDVSLPQRLEQQKAFLDGHPDYGAVAGLVEYVPHRKGTEGFKRYVEWNNGIRTYNQILKNQFIEMPLINPTVMWRKSTGEKVGLYRKGNFPEDYEMWLRWLAAGVHIAKLPQAVLQWHDSDRRLSRTKPEYSDKAFYRIKSVYLARWLTRNNPFHPGVLVWGASKISRRRARLLEEQGIHVHAYIDTKKTRQLHKEVLYYKDIPSASEAFVLVYIKQRNAREEIARFLENQFFEEGKNFLLVS